MKKGFTLIELLAVIIVLAAILAIVIPTVTNLTNSSKRTTKEASIDLYGKAASEAVLVYELERKVSPKTFEDIEPFIEYKGDDVSCETKIINADNSIFISGCTVGSKLIKDYSYGKQVCELISGDKNTLGSKYKCEVKPGVKYYFYVLSQNTDGTTNLIMDQNINSDGTPAGMKGVIQSSNASQYNLVAWNNENGQTTSIHGPVTAMQFLYNATKDWTNISPMNYIYKDREVQGIPEDNTTTGYISFESTNGVATITPLLGESTTIGTETKPLRVRMIIYSSNASITEVTNKTDAPYLYDNLDIHGNSAPIAYWTLSSFKDYNCYAWFVEYNGIVDNDFYYVNDYDSYGVRPVINMKL